MASHNDCRAVVLYKAPSSLKDATEHVEEQYVILPIVLSWLSNAASHPPLLYQPVPPTAPPTLVVIDSKNVDGLKQGEGYISESVFCSYDISCQWGRNLYERVGRTDGEHVERMDASTAEKAWYDAAPEVPRAVKMMTPARHARL
ncbi:hypothetical protein B0H11DRAFT_2219373 [Mycena galericulata]|nr:hypothetical protein B0H11DRAFT_2219373 [Mycena galericulata]